MRNGRRRMVGIGTMGALIMMAATVVLAAAPAGAQDKPTVAVTGVDLSAGTIEITNHGDADVDPNGLILCNFPAYAPIDGADMIGPGETITVDSGATGVALDAAGGEMGLYTTNDFEDPDSMVTYVEWGDSGHQRSSVAVAAGVWDGGVAEAEGDVLSASVDNPTSAADWAGAAEATLAVTGVDSNTIALVAAIMIASGIVVLFFVRRERSSSPA